MSIELILSLEGRRRRGELCDKTGEVVDVITASESESEMSDKGGWVLVKGEGVVGVVVVREFDLETEGPRDEGLRDETIESRSFCE